jgi:hypothetical protein
MIDLHTLRSQNVVKIWPGFEAIGLPLTAHSVDTVV